MLRHQLKVVFRQGEQYRNGLELSDHQQSVCVRGVDHIARVHKSQPNLSIDGRFNVAVGQVQLGIVDLRIVGTHQTFLLRHHGLLRVVLLLSDDALFIQVGIALQVALSILQVCLILVFRGLDLGHLHFVRPRIN